ncbi:MAG: hypothetical protein WC869_16075 [Phycisphaerae bacterium]
MPTDLPTTYVPWELRAKVVVLFYPVLGLIWLLSWLRFAFIALDIGHWGALADRQLWVWSMTDVLLRNALRSATAEGAMYSTRVVKAALAHLYPKPPEHP